MNELRVAFKAEPIPVPGATADLVYFPPLLDGTPEYWTLRLYRDNLRKFNGTDQEAIAHWAFRTIERCSKISTILPEVFEEEPHEER